ncbi:MAG TPA: acetylglutamate kinase [Polyangiaceae bacterium]|nr:acetylglutamate kinase [Polyangiaceae bacterium]
MSGALEGAVVVKLGGEVIAGPELAFVAADVAALAASRPVVLVHGGGPQATKLQEALGQTPKKIAGRRFTDEATLDVMKMVVAGKLNVDLCSALVRAGARPVGLHGASARVIAAEKRPARVYSGAGPDPIDLGLVGDVIGVDRALLSLLTSNGYVPVLACLGAGADGQAYNINADIVATRVAVELAAASLLLVSDVRGVLRDVKDPSSRIAKLTVAQGRELISTGVVKEGMIPKLEESFGAIAAGAKQVHILGKLAAGDLLREASEPGSVGTALVA